MSDTPQLPSFGSYLLQELLADVKADFAPDVQGVLQIAIQGGFEAFLLPQNNLTVMALLVKMQADAMATGNDLSKQIATYFSLWLAAKFPQAPAKSVAAPR